MTPFFVFKSCNYLNFQTQANYDMKNLHVQVTLSQGSSGVLYRQEGDTTLKEHLICSPVDKEFNE